MKTNLKKTINTLVSLLVGALLFWYVYSKMDFSSIVENLKNIHYFPLFLSIVLAGISYYIRGKRWKRLIVPLNEETPTDFSMTMAMMVGNFANLIIPRAGEIARCGYLSKYHKVTFSKLIGTMIAERLTDLLCIIIISITTIALEWNTFSTFFTQNQSSTSFIDRLSSPWVWGSILVVIILIVLFIVFYNKIKNTLLNMWNGVKTIFELKDKWKFLGESVLIWMLFFGLFHVCIYAFDFSSNLTIGESLTLFVLGCLGILAPVQGGVGPWHYMVIFGLTFLGYAETDAGAFALVVHGVQMIAYIIFGILALILSPIVNKQKVENNE